MLFWQGLVKGGVENRCPGHVGKPGQGCANSGQVDRIVQGRKARAVLNGSDNIVINKRGLTEGLAAMNYPVAHGRGSRRHQSFILQYRNLCIERLLVTGAWVQGNGFAQASNMGKRIVLAEALGEGRSQLVMLAIEQGEFQG